MFCACVRACVRVHVCARAYVRAHAARSQCSECCTNKTYISAAHHRMFLTLLLFPFFFFLPILLSLFALRLFYSLLKRYCVAEILSHFCPKLVDMNVYHPVSATPQKVTQWNTLNKKCKDDYSPPERVCTLPSAELEQ